MAFKEICGLKEYCKHEVLEHTIELSRVFHKTWNIEITMGD